MPSLFSAPEILSNTKFSVEFFLLSSDAIKKVCAERSISAYAYFNGFALSKLNMFAK